MPFDNISKLPIVIVFLLLIISPVAFCADSVSVYIPAVEETGGVKKGAIATLEVYAKNGTGHVFVDTLPLTEIDTQAGARVAKEAAEEVLGKNLDNYDIFFVIRSNAPIVGGPSAGSSMATSLLALLLNLSADKGVVMTGTVGLDGSIGPVGGLLEKAQAVAENGGIIFLIPEGQSMVSVQKTSQIPIQNGIAVENSQEQMDIRVYARKKWNLTVLEVGDINDALGYVSGYRLSARSFGLNKSNQLETAMKSMAYSFMSETEKMFLETKNKLSVSSITYEQESQLSELLDDQEIRISDARKMIENGEYYSSSSYCYAASAHLRFISNSIDILESDNPSFLMENRLKMADTELDKISELVEQSKNTTDNVNDIEILLLSSERLDEARVYMKDAWKSFYNDHISESSYALSYAEERAQTVRRWLNLTTAFGGDSFNFDFYKLKELCELRIGEANSFITYAKLIGIDTNETEEMMQNAMKNFDSGEYSASLFNTVSIRAELEAVMGSGIIESGSDSANDALKRMEQGALRDIEITQQSGILPIVAMNYYEYGKSLEKESPADAALYLTYARNFAKASRNIKEVFDGRDFGNGHEDVVLTKVSYPTQQSFEIHFLCIIFFISGLFVGFVVFRNRRKGSAKFIWKNK